MKFSKLLSAAMVLLFITACQNKYEPTTVKRYGSVVELRPEKIAYYKKLHANTWPGVLKAIKANNIRNYSIYLKQIADKYYLFSYYEYVGKDYAGDMKKIGTDTVTQRWWKETAPCQKPLPDAAAKNETWSQMEEVFHAN